MNLCPFSLSHILKKRISQNTYREALKNDTPFGEYHFYPRSAPPSLPLKGICLFIFIPQYDFAKSVSKILKKQKPWIKTQWTSIQQHPSSAKAEGF